MDLHRMAVRIPLGVTLLLVATAAGPASEDVSRKELRAARAAVAEGRWDESLEVYERILATGYDDDTIVAEALLTVTLGRLVEAQDPEATAAARERCARLAAMPGHGRELEAAAVEALLTALEVERQGRAELAAALAAEVEGRAEDQLAAAEALAAEKALFDRQRRRNRALVRRLELSQRQQAELAALFEAKQVELTETNADLDFLIAHVSGAQQDQAAMLAAVKAKNEELLAKERELQRTRLALNERESRLAVQEEEVRKREEAMREVTERILAKDESGP